VVAAAEKKYLKIIKKIEGWHAGAKVLKRDTWKWFAEYLGIKHHACKRVCGFPKAGED